MTSTMPNSFLTRFAHIALILVLAVLSENCLNSGDASLQLERKFWARKINLQNGTSTQYQINADQKRNSKYVTVFAEKGNNVSDSVISNLVSVVEGTIIPIEHTWLTSPMDVDQNGKVILLLMDIDDGYQTGGNYIAGYFDAINQFSDADTNSQLQLRSNHSEMLYLDTYPANPNSTAFYATLAHEYQHLLQFTNNYPNGVVEETWVDEGLAEVMSDITGFGPQTARADYFRSAILASDSLIQFNNSDPLRDYSSAYMYFRYIYDIYGLGGISQIFRMPETGVAGVNRGIQSVDSAITSHCGNTVGLAQPYFACSYRLMWAGLVNTLGALPATVNINFDGSAGTMNTTGSVNYNWNVSDLAWRNTIANTLVSGSRSRPASATSTGPLTGYAPTLFLTNYPTGAPAAFSACTACGMTIIAGNLFFAVFNHNISSTAQSTNVIDLQLNGGNTTTNMDKHAPGLSHTPDATDKPVRWHFPLPRSHLESLKHKARNQKRTQKADEQ